MRQLERGWMQCQSIPVAFWDVDAISSFEYMLGVFLAAMQDNFLVCDCEKAYSAGQAM
jgi:hypothetical protein